LSCCVVGYIKKRNNLGRGNERVREGGKWEKIKWIEEYGSGRSSEIER